MSLWLPGTARSEIARDNQAIQEMVLINEAVQHFTQELKAIDPDLELVKASNNASLAGLTPGYWHILRKGTPTHIMCLEGPNGEYREPGAWMFDWVLEQDAWNDRTQRMKKEMANKAAASARREKDRERQDRIDELNERWHSATHASVGFSGTKRQWAAAAGARRSR